MVKAVPLAGGQVTAAIIHKDLARSENRRGRSIEAGEVDRSPKPERTRWPASARLLPCTGRGRFRMPGLSLISRRTGSFVGDHLLLQRKRRRTAAVRAGNCRCRPGSDRFGLRRPAVRRCWSRHQAGYEAANGAASRSSGSWSWRLTKSPPFQARSRTEEIGAGADSRDCRPERMQLCRSRSHRDQCGHHRAGTARW